jgi:hypothetical protein
VPLQTDVGIDRPLRLSVAAALAFPDGSMTASGLRRECERGRLVIERIAGKDYTTLSAIEKMRELCRKPPKDPAYGSARKLRTRINGKIGWDRFLAALQGAATRPHRCAVGGSL